MSLIKDFANKIKLLFSGNKQKKLNAPEKRINPDLILQYYLNRNNIAYFEIPSNYNEYCRKFFENPKNFEMQYDYVQLISELQYSGVMQDFLNEQAFIEQNKDLYYPSEIHGISHTTRVLLNAVILSSLDNLPENEKRMVIVAAQLHDIGRKDDDRNFDHGKASVEKIEKMGLLERFSPREKAIIEFAISNHSLDAKGVEAEIEKLPKKDRKDYRRIIDYLQDADKLDRTRIGNPGWGLDPERLETDTAKKLVKFAHQNYFEFNRTFEYIKTTNRRDKNGNSIIDYFNYFRSRGYNITLQDFISIISEYKPGTIEELALEGHLEELFSYKTFIKYRKNTTFNESIKDGLDHDTIYKEITEIEQTSLMQETFDRDFMLLYNLKKNDYRAYKLLCRTDIDLAYKYIVGVAHEIGQIDVDRFFSRGFDFRLNDIILLASKVTPEEYRKIISEDKIEDLLNSKYEKRPERVEELWNSLNQYGLRISREEFEKNYRLYQYLGPKIIVEVSKLHGLERYSIVDVFSAYTKLSDASYRIANGRKSNFIFNAQTLIDLLDYSNSTHILNNVQNEDQKLSIVELFAKNPNLARDPRFISYYLRKDFVYQAESYDQIINYGEYCADRIISDNKIPLQDAKSKFIRTVFNFNCLAQNMQEFEDEAVASIYYYRKYIESFAGKSSYSDAECDFIMAKIEDAFNAGNIAEFKQKLSEYKHLINRYNTEEIFNIMRNEVLKFSKKSIINGLQETEKYLSSIPYYNVSTSSGESAKVKILRGEEFYLATSTILPHCSSKAYRIRTDSTNPREDMLKELRDTKIKEYGICTSITYERMIAHAKSAVQDQELIFGYVPQKEDSVSVLACYDLCTTGKKRSTDRATTPRSIMDFVSSTIEEHNEVVMDKVRPRFIICYDQISDIAVMKQREIQRIYDLNGNGEKIDIILIDAKGKYLPRIKHDIEREHAYVMEVFSDGKFNAYEFRKLFEEREGSITTRTLQAIHSTEYTEGTWSPEYTKQLLDSLISVYERVSEVVPPSKARSLLNNVNLLLERADTTRECFGRRYYDQNYSDKIDTERLKKILEKLLDIVVPYEELVSREEKKAREKTEDIPIV